MNNFTPRVLSVQNYKKQYIIYEFHFGNEWQQFFFKDVSMGTYFTIYLFQ